MSEDIESDEKWEGTCWSSGRDITNEIGTAIRERDKLGKKPITCWIEDQST